MRFSIEVSDPRRQCCERSAELLRSEVKSPPSRHDRSVPGSRTDAFFEQSRFHKPNKVEVGTFPPSPQKVSYTGLLPTTIDRELRRAITYYYRPRSPRGCATSVPSTRAHPRWAAASPTLGASPRVPRSSKDLRAPVGRVNPPPWPARISPGTVAPTPGRRGSTAPPASRTPSPRIGSPRPSPRARVRARGG